MENATDALLMAAAVLVFVVALSISMFTLTEARQSAEAVLSMKDRETDYIYGNYYYDSTGITTRKVGLETIIPTIFHMLEDENTTIAFYKGGSADKTADYFEDIKINDDNEFPKIYTYNKKVVNNNNETTLVSINSRILDLNSDTGGVSLANKEQKRKFLNGIVYRSFEEVPSGISLDNETYYKRSFFPGVTNTNPLGDEAIPLYNYFLKNKNVIEWAGLYYQDDLGKGKEEINSKPSTNKTLKRLIIYEVR